MFSQVDHTLGFHEIKSDSEKVPNHAAIEAQSSFTCVMYHDSQVLTVPVVVGDALAVTVGGIGRSLASKFATQ